MTDDAFFDQIVFLFPSRVFAMWSETEVNGTIFPIFSIYVRDPYSHPNISGIEREVEQFCGAEATNATSGFHGVNLSYANNPPCFDAGIPREGPDDGVVSNEGYPATTSYAIHTWIMFAVLSQCCW